MSAWHCRDTCFGYKQVSSRARSRTAVPVGLCTRLIVMCCYLSVATLGAVQSCCLGQENGGSSQTVLPCGHKALLSSYMLRISSNFTLSSFCKFFSLLLPFILTGDKFTSFPPEKSATFSKVKLIYFFSFILIPASFFTLSGTAL